MGQLVINKYGVNAKIKANILPDEEMRKLGFTDYFKTKWYFCKSINFPKEKKYSTLDISFNVSIDKTGNDDLKIEILDEDFCQPYDYQYILYKDKSFETALIVKEQVEEWMKYLKDNGVLSGHEYGEYI